MSNFLALRYSDDGGKNFKPSRDLDLGDTGHFLPQVIARRLGMTRQRVWEISDTSAYPNVILGAEIEAE